MDLHRIQNVFINAIRNNPDEAERFKAYLGAILDLTQADFGLILQTSDEGISVSSLVKSSDSRLEVRDEYIRLIQEQAGSCIKDASPRAFSHVFSPEETAGFLVVPFVNEEPTKQVLCVALHNPSEDTSASLMVFLQLVIGYWYASSGTLIRRTADRRGGSRRSDFSFIHPIEDILDAIEGGNSGVPGILESFRKRTKCDRIFIGRVRGKKIKLVAISGETVFNSADNVLDRVQDAMKEALANKRVTSWTHGSEVDISSSNLIHKETCRDLQWNSIASYPIHTEKDTLGIMTLVTRFGGSEEPDYPTEKGAQNIGLLSLLAYQSRPSLWSKVKRQLFNKRWKVVAQFTAIIMAMIFIKVPSHVSCKGKLRPEIKQVVAAPFESSLVESNVRPGDLLEEGQELAVLDERVFRMEMAEAQSLMNKTMKQRDNLLASSNADPALLQIAQHEIASYQEAVNILQYKLDNLELVAPFPGILLSGDLSHVKGVTLRTGQPLFEVAKLNEMYVEVEIQEEDLARITKGMATKIRFFANPNEVFMGELARIYPQSYLRDGQGVFLAEAPLLESTDRIASLRPGMRGTVKVHIGDKSLFWIVFHRLWEYLLSFV